MTANVRHVQGCIPPTPRSRLPPLALPGCLLDDVLEEDEPRVQSSLDLLQKEEDLLVVWNRKEQTEEDQPLIGPNESTSCQSEEVYVRLPGFLISLVMSARSSLLTFVVSV